MAACGLRNVGRRVAGGVVRGDDRGESFSRRREILKANRERLGELRLRPDWPQALDSLAQQAAAIGRLIEADNWAIDIASADAQSSSRSSDVTSPARVPFSFRELPITQASYYARLEEALLKVLGSPKKFDHCGDDD